MLNIDISNCSIMQKLPEHLIIKIMLYNRHPIAEIFNNKLFYDYEFTNKLAININTISNKICYETEYIFIVENGDEYENLVFLNCFRNKLKYKYIHNVKYDYINTINSKVYKPNGKTEQNYAARFF